MFLTNVFAFVWTELFELDLFIRSIGIEVIDFILAL